MMTANTDTRKKYLDTRLFKRAVIEMMRIMLAWVILQTAFWFVPPWWIFGYIVFARLAWVWIVGAE